MVVNLAILVRGVRGKVPGFKQRKKAQTNYFISFCIKPVTNFLNQNKDKYEDK